MTYIHFINCALLAFAPSFVVFQASKLREYGALSLVLRALAGAVLTLFAKVFLLATFAPDSGGSSLARGVVVSGLDVAELWAIVFFLRSVTSEASVKALGAGVGWSLGVNIATRLVPMWVGARSLEFSWDYLWMAVDANLTIVFYVAAAAALQALQRRGVSKTVTNLSYVCLALFGYQVFVTGMLHRSLFLVEKVVVAVAQCVVGGSVLQSLGTDVKRA